MIHNSTPVEFYLLQGKKVAVKREDLCCPLPGPSFSKMRGVYAHLSKRSETVIGVLDTYHSQAGHAVAYACSNLGKSAINYWPVYKADGRELIRAPQQASRSLGAKLCPLPAARSAILYHRAKKHLKENYADSYMIANALKLQESVDENATEAARTPFEPYTHFIISISSGTVAAGVIRGLLSTDKPFTVTIHLGYTRSISSVQNYLIKMIGSSFPLNHTQFIDEKYQYADKVDRKDIPFPCNPYYDAKAWDWLDRNIQNLPYENIMFWNIGA
jgi:hypothetical protein